MVSRSDVNHTFSDSELDELCAFGTIESHKAGDLLVAEGTMAPDCIVTLSGHTDIFASTDDGPKRVGWMERGQFAGDLSVLTGQRHLSRVEMGADGEVLRIKHADFQRLIAGNSHYSDIFVRVLSARREFSNQRGFAATIVIGAALGGACRRRATTGSIRASSTCAFDHTPRSTMRCSTLSRATLAASG